MLVSVPVVGAIVCAAVIAVMMFMPLFTSRGDKQKTGPDEDTNKRFHSQILLKVTLHIDPLRPWGFARGTLKPRKHSAETTNS